MNKFIILLLVMVFVIVLSFVRKFRGKTLKEPTIYSYGRKDFLMSKAENDFFSVIKEILQDRYQIFPQVHLTALLNEKMVKGQNWKAAFRHINGKSVDFVVCDKVYSRPLLAIELDDYSHDTDERRVRDVEVERMFKTAGLPLLRFRGYKNMSHETLASQLESVLQNPK